MLHRFTLHRPRSLEEAFRLAQTLGAGTRWLAGGTELLTRLRQGREEAQHLVALGWVPELRVVREEEDGALWLGGLATLASLERSEAVHRRYPVLLEAIRHMGSPQLRARATLGGNFCGAVPCADIPPVCIVGDAELVLRGPGGERRLPAERFFRAPRKPELDPEEILYGVRIPPQPPGAGHAYERFGLREGNALAVAGVAVRVLLKGQTIREARVAHTAVAPVPSRAPGAEASLRGAAPTAEAYARAAEAAAREARPIDDLRGSATFRRHLVAVLTRRALERAVRAAQQKEVAS